MCCGGVHFELPMLFNVTSQHFVFLVCLFVCLCVDLVTSFRRYLVSVRKGDGEPDQTIVPGSVTTHAVREVKGQPLVPSDEVEATVAYVPVSEARMQWRVSFGVARSIQHPRLIVGVLSVAHVAGTAPLLVPVRTSGSTPRSRCRCERLRLPIRAGAVPSHPATPHRRLCLRLGTSQKASTPLLPSAYMQT